MGAVVVAGYFVIALAIAIVVVAAGLTALWCSSASRRRTAIEVLKIVLRVRTSTGKRDGATQNDSRGRPRARSIKSDEKTLLFQDLLAVTEFPAANCQ